MDKRYLKQYREIVRLFSETAPVLQAIGDATRQQIILSMIELPCQAKGGVRVGAITEKTHLSRPAVSHHLKILKDAGVIGMRSEGTKNYYYLTNEYAKFDALLKLFESVMDLSRQINADQPAEAT